MDVSERFALNEAMQGFYSVSDRLSLAGIYVLICSC
jgi:hypothetical protein